MMQHTAQLSTQASFEHIYWLRGMQKFEIRTLTGLVNLDSHNYSISL